MAIEEISMDMQRPLHSFDKTLGHLLSMLRSEDLSSLQQITDATRPTQEQPITLENMFHFCYMARK